MSKKLFGFIFGLSIIFVSIFMNTIVDAALDASITKFIPISGNTGQSVVITGVNLTPVNRVLFNGVDAGDKFHADSPTQITVTVPLGAKSGPIEVEKADKSIIMSTTNFTVVSPSSINLSVKNITSNSADVVFREDILYRPYTGTVISKTDVKDYQYLSATLDQIVNGVVTMKAIGLKPGTTYNVKIINVEGVSTETSFTTSGNFDAPSITDFKPDSGKVGDTIVIAGYNLLLSSVDGIYFSDMIQTSGIVSHDPSTGQTLISVKVPEGAKTGNITLNTIKGAVSSPKSFTVNTNTTTGEGGGAGVVAGTNPSQGGFGATNISDVEFKGLVPICNTGEIDGETGHYKNPCNFVTFMAFINKLIKFLLFDIATPLVALIIMYTGYLYITAGGNPSQAEKAKHILLNVVFGYIIALAAWLIITAILNIFNVTDPTISSFLGK